jgi:hypothetical protein
MEISESWLGGGEKPKYSYETKLQRPGAPEPRAPSPSPNPRNLCKTMQNYVKTVESYQNPQNLLETYCFHIVLHSFA